VTQQAKRSAAAHRGRERGTTRRCVSVEMLASGGFKFKGNYNSGEAEGARCICVRSMLLHMYVCACVSMCVYGVSVCMFRMYMLDKLKMLTLQLQQTVQLNISKMRAQRRYQRMQGAACCCSRSVCQRRR